MAIKCPPTPRTVNLVLFGLFLLAIVMCRGLSSTEARNKCIMHMINVQKFQCGPPQPRAIKAEELEELKDLVESSVNIEPHTTVLHRCDNGTGYCADKSLVCKVAKVDQVILYFKIEDTFQGIQAYYKEVIVQNHTKCACQSRHNIIK